MVLLSAKQVLGTVADLVYMFNVLEKTRVKNLDSLNVSFVGRSNLRK